jgi:FAD-linked sulfhydryl oxidase
MATPPPHPNPSEEEDCDTCDVLKRLTKMGLQKKLAERTQPTKPSTASTTSSAGGTTSPKKKVTDEFWEMKPPPDLVELGNSGWTLLHTLAAYYPKNPTKEKKEDVKNFLYSFAKVFPCHDCAKDFQQVLQKSPPNLSSQEEFAQWMCQAHNHVNVKLGKPEFDCSKVQERWKASFHKEEGKP